MLVLVVSVAWFVLHAGISQALPPPGHISAIDATFIPSDFATDYTVQFSGFTAPITVTWKLTLECIDTGCPDPTGTIASPRPDVDTGCNNNSVGTSSPYVQTLTAGEAPDFVWHHPSAAEDPTGTYHCDHAKEGPHGHQGLITIQVSDAETICTATFRGTESSTPSSTSDGTASVPDCEPVPNIPPTPRFRVTLKRENNGTVTAMFDGTLSSDPDDTIDRYDWGFGDGNTRLGPFAAHTYAEPGFYVVELTVTDARGASGITAEVIKVERPPPGPAAPPTGSALGLSDRQKLRFLTAGIGEGVASLVVAVATLGAAASGVGAPAVPVLAGVTIGLSTASVGSTALAHDPADRHFTEIVTPRFPPVSRARAGGGLSPVGADALNGLAVNTSRIAGYENALVTSLDRASTALRSHDPRSATRQVQAAAQFATRAAALLDRDPSLRRQAADALASIHLSVHMSLAAEARLRADLKAHGLPARAQRRLTRLGVPTAERQGLRRVIVDAKPASISFPSALTSAALNSAERQEAAALRSLADTWSA